MTDALEKAAYLELLRQFSHADRERAFAFSAGVVGAVPMRDRELLDLLQGKAPGALAAGLAIESLKVLVAALIPARNLALLARTLLRTALNPRPRTLYSTTVVSVGSAAGPADPYFGAFLANAGEAYNYLKIVGGRVLRADAFSFVESSLSAAGLLRLSVLALVQPLVALSSLAASAARIDGAISRRLYVLLGLKEIHGGTVFQNRLTMEALQAHVGNDAVRVVIFPMEGRSWEKRLIAAVNARRARASGYLHCALTPRHAGLLHPGFFAAHEIPAIIRTAGTIAAKAIAGNFPGVEVRPGCFIRGDLSGAGRRDAGLLLFALTGNIEESTRILQSIAAFAARKAHRVVVRLNPNASTYGYLCDVARKLGLKTWEDAGRVVPGLCFFRSSSVAIGYLRMKVVPVYLDLEDVISNNSFELDPVHRFESVRVDAGFGDAVAALVARYGEAGIGDGPAIADLFLDQRYDPKTLAGLHELS